MENDFWLFRTTAGNILRTADDHYFRCTDDWDSLINESDLHSHLATFTRTADVVEPSEATRAISSGVLAPIASQEVWAAGVTYLRSRDARQEESKEAGGADFYERVYDAERPELFFKALPHRVSAHGEEVFIRRDSAWNVPEPELTLFIDRRGEIQAYTVGNDMSSRSIEGENPLYLPQAKSYERSCAIGPCLYVPAEPIPPATAISISIVRQDAEVFSGSIQISQMKRSLETLADWLYRECDFPNGCFLMTGTGVVPPPEFTLAGGDVVSITIENIGTLTNRVAMRAQKPA